MTETVGLIKVCFHLSVTFCNIGLITLILDLNLVLYEEFSGVSN